jgi:hypothetical protein
MNTKKRFFDKPFLIIITASTSGEVVARLLPEATWVPLPQILKALEAAGVAFQETGRRAGKVRPN